jgi:glycosyltransferase involved in cell wall biosynthesis
VPTLRNRIFLEIASNLKAFLNVDAGLVRGPVPKSESTVQAQRLKSVRDRKLKRAQKRIQNKNKKVKQLQEELSKEHQRAAALQADLDKEPMRTYVLDNYGYERGLPVVDLSDVFPNLEETVTAHDFLEYRALPTDVVLLKGLAKRSRACKCLQIGAWREESTANIAAVAQECISVNVSDEDFQKLGFSGSFIAERASYHGDTKDVTYNSCTFDCTNFRDYFDLVFVDGHRSSESLKLVTENAFDLSKGTGSTIVWHGYISTPGEINWQVLAGILDGCPESRLNDLYYVSGTSCVICLDESFSGVRDRDYRRSKRAFDVKLTARSVPRKLVILDDAFPNLQSAFRIAEYNAYLERWKDAAVYSTASSRVSLPEAKGFGRVLEEYASLYPQLRSRIFEFGGKINLRSDVAYFVFLGNAARFLDTIEEHNAPFVFTLYPGGGFKLDQEDSDEKLRRTCSSPNFEKVIVTQRVTHEYLIDRQFCDPGKIEFVYGGVFPSSHRVSRPRTRSYYKENKDTFDVCFVAYKYTPRSIVSKGYDVFVEVAKQLSRMHGDILFHVVGTFDESDIDVSDIGGKIRFYGPRTTEFFPAFYSQMDIILAPNAPFALFPGAFDGFPTGACIEAGLCGVAVFCSDPLDQNIVFKDGEEIVIIPRDAEVISATIDGYCDRYEDLRRLAKRGQEAFTRVFDLEAQMEPRLRILSELLGKDHLAEEW